MFHLKDGWHDFGDPLVRSVSEHVRGKNRDRTRLFKMKHLPERSLVGVLGIEPSLHEPESCVLPAYATPQ